ncbi:hypothetical protein A4A49_25697 [Nicotiana attenuata]|uniref:Uncharacterized protein n=1 Tax=Nicotiana attenuata TaxID=49451 RepID=A0A1J6J7L1_NICAT|nr:hypothetical protein A4A49_25697 [Nicotiana attenuata]
MGRGRSKRVIQITNSSKEPSTLTKVDGKEQSRGIEDMQNLQNAMEQLQRSNVIWPPLHGAISARSPSIDKGGHSQTLKAPAKSPNAERIEVEKEVQRNETQRMEVMKQNIEQEVQIHKNLDEEQ